jgi:hypothetical protein
MLRPLSPGQIESPLAHDRHNPFLGSSPVYLDGALSASPPLASSPEFRTTDQILSRVRIVPPSLHSLIFLPLSTDYNEQQALEVVGLFPSIALGINAIFRTLGGPAKSAKELGAFRTHCIHWFVFCLDMKLKGDMALEISPRSAASGSWPWTPFILPPVTPFRAGPSKRQPSSNSSSAWPSYVRIPTPAIRAN